MFCWKNVLNMLNMFSPFLENFPENSEMPFIACPSIFHAPFLPVPWWDSGLCSCQRPTEPTNCLEK